MAVDLAEQIFEDLTGKQALLIGAGEMTEVALAALRERGLASVAITNRTPSAPRRSRCASARPRTGSTSCRACSPSPTWC